jgi:hypothetical protein
MNLITKLDNPFQAQPLLKAFVPQTRYISVKQMKKHTVLETSDQIQVVVCKGFPATARHSSLSKLKYQTSNKRKITSRH